MADSILTFRGAVEIFNMMAHSYDGLPLTDTGTTDSDALAALAFIGARVSALAVARPGSTYLASITSCTPGRLFALNTDGFHIRGNWGVPGVGDTPE
ncbi:MAG TPA: hypothetical protein VH062_09850 [Polyangiaceae bacterium]|jgi:hypothetical protein|nr:hypothetical protein [Polyangiaceae bacterium]